MKEPTLVANGWSNDGPRYFMNLWIKYRVNAQIFNRFWAEQEGRCAGCNGALAHPVNRSLSFGLKPEVDHDHRKKLNDPGYARGLLCRRCNDWLGKLNDDIEIVRRLLAYLAKHGGL